MRFVFVPMGWLYYLAVGFIGGALLPGPWWFSLSATLTFGFWSSFVVSFR